MSSFSVELMSTQVPRKLERLKAGKGGPAGMQDKELRHPPSAATVFGPANKPLGTGSWIELGEEVYGHRICSHVS
jgi:hypothetical protein